jgi:VanZ family protein
MKMVRWAILFSAVIVAIIVLADAGKLGSVAWLYDFPGGDKVGHFVLFGILSLLVNLAAMERRGSGHVGQVVLKVSVVLAVLIGLEELSQNWFASRTSSWTDLAASYLGVATFAWMALEITKRLGRASPPHG